MKADKKKLESIRMLFDAGFSKSAEILSKIINKPVHVKVPEIYLLPVDEAMKVVGKLDERVVSVYVKVHEGIKIAILLIMSEDSAKHIVKSGIKKDIPEETGYFKGVVEEIANILISYILNTLSNILKRRIIPEIPDFAFDMKGAVLDMVLAEHRNENLEVLLVFTDVYYQDTLKLSFILIPEDNIVNELFEKTCNI